MRRSWWRRSGPKMLALSAEKTRGAVPYNVTPKHTAQAAKILGPNKWLAVEQKVTIETDPAKARALGRKELARYMVLPNYRNNWLREGFSEADLGDGGSDKFIDAMVPVGRCGHGQEGAARPFRGRCHARLPAAGPCRRRLRGARPHAGGARTDDLSTESDMEFGIALPTAADSWKVVAARRGARLHPRLVLRHADAERRLLRRHGRGGGQDHAASGSAPAC